MINVRAIANTAIQPINKDIEIILRVSTGFTIGAGAKQIPTYADDLPGVGQLQALDGDDLKQIEKMNLQGNIKALYVRGAIAGVLRPDQKGGDLVIINGRTWLVVKVLEAWPTWAKAAIRLQDDA